MWLHLPTSVCSPDAGASTSPSDSLCQMLAASVTWNTSYRQPKYWRAAWLKGRLTKHLSIPTCEPSTATDSVVAWMDSSAASHVPTCPLPASKPELAKKPEAGCGLNTLDSFARFNPNGVLSRTSRQLSVFQQEESYSVSLPRAGTMRNGYLYERPPLALRTGGSGCSSWPSPRSEDSESAANHPGAVDSLTGAAKLWTTPQTHDQAGGNPNRVRRKGTEHGCANLADDVTAWSTPSAHDGRRPGSDAASTQGRNLKREVEELWQTPADDVTQWQTPATDSFRSRGGDRKDEMGLDQQARAFPPLCHSSPPVRGWVILARSMTSESFTLEALSELGNSIKRNSPTQCDGSPSSTAGPGSRRPSMKRKLNAYFVELLMAFPTGWTSTKPLAPRVYEVWATRWSRRVRQLHLEYLQKEQD